MISNFIVKEEALSHPFANDQYDHENAKEDFILGHESYKEWLEQLPSISAVNIHEVIRCACKHFQQAVGTGGAILATCTLNNRRPNPDQPWIWCDLECPYLKMLSDMMYAKRQMGEAEEAEPKQPDQTEGR